MSTNSAGGIIPALEILDKRLREQKLGHLISHKKIRNMFGSRVDAGNIGLYDHAGKPKVVKDPGNYWNFRHFTREFVGSFNITSHLDKLGLTMAICGQGEALVVEDPQSRVFIVRNDGFVSYGLKGRYRILEVVDTLDLGDKYAYREADDKSRILGFMRPVMTSKGGISYSAAQFFDVPANNILILQRGNEIISMGAGQHVTTNPNITFRNFFSLGERQTTFRTQPAYTVETVPVILTINLRYRVYNPVKLTLNYPDPLQALINPAQTAVNSVVSRLSYTQFMRAKNTSGDIPDVNNVHCISPTPRSYLFS